MKFQLAPCLVLWDFKTDGWPPVPISNPSPQPRPPWIELRRALAWFRLAPCLVLWDFGWHLVWFLWDFKADGWPPVPISNPSPQPRPPWIALLLRFRLAPCLVLWDFKTDGWPSVPISKAPPQPRLPWSCCWAFGSPPVWFYGISKLTDGPLSRSQTLPHSRDLLGLNCCWAFGWHPVWFDGIHN